MNSRAQVSSYDIMVALFLFVLVFATVRSIWLNNVSAFEREQLFVEMEFKGGQAINSLIKTRGYPENWESSNVELIGLAEKQNVLDSNKLQNFIAMDYETAKEKMRLGKYDFNFSLQAKNPSDNVEAGMPLDSNSSIINFRRAVKYKGGEAVVEFKVFTD